MHRPPSPDSRSFLRQYFDENPDVLEWLLTRGSLTALCCATALAALWMVLSRDERAPLQAPREAAHTAEPAPATQARLSGLATPAHVMPGLSGRTVETTTTNRTTEWLDTRPVPPVVAPKMGAPKTGAPADNTSPQPQPVPDRKREPVPQLQPARVDPGKPDALEDEARRSPPAPPVPRAVAEPPVPALPQFAEAGPPAHEPLRPRIRAEQPAENDPPQPAAADGPPGDVAQAASQTAAARELSPQRLWLFQREQARIAQIESWRFAQERRIAATRAAVAKMRADRAVRDARHSARVSADHIDWPDTIQARYQAQIRTIEACLSESDFRGNSAACAALLARLKSDLRSEGLSGFSPAGYLEARYFVEWVRSSPPALSAPRSVALDLR